MTAAMTYAQTCQTGGRAVNEDAVLCALRGPDACFAVADGLGGHGKGDAASQKVKEIFEREFLAGNGTEAAGEFLPRAFAAAQDGVISLQKKKNEMKTTVVALALIKNKFAWIHAGDSRIYYFKKAKLRERSLDHSVPQMLVMAGEIKESDIASHPERNKLLKVIGDKSEGVRYDLSKERKISKGGAFLLCTDGFWENLTPGFIQDCLKQAKNAEEWLGLMTAEIKKAENGETDNYSAVTVMI
jgi:serine/threonine protein phosphatase PrpC